MAQLSRVLIIDDHIGLQTALATALQFDEHVELAGTARTLSEGMALIDKDQIDAVILDLHLPDMSGLEAVKTLRAHAPDKRIVVYSAADDDALMDSTRPYADQVIRKGALRPLLEALRPPADN